MNSTLNHLGLTIGIVKNNADPGQHGRLQIFIPAIDSDSYKTADLPWATYVSPFGGSTANTVVGRSKKKVNGVSTYGFWGIPQNGAQVVCAFLNGNPKMRIWLGCTFVPELTRTMPQGIEGYKSEIDQTGLYPQAPMTHITDNLTAAGLGPGSPLFSTRGGERSIAYPKNGADPKPITDGYGAKGLEGASSESQALTITTPGRHYLLMSDVVDNCKIRLRTTEGSQIILDDTNERIYVSTAQGKNWVELDEGNGNIYVYSDGKINMRSKGDFNIYSDSNLNLVAKNRVNVISESAGVKIAAVNNVDVSSSGGDLRFNATCGITIKTSGGGAAAAGAGEAAGSGSSIVTIDSAAAVSVKTAAAFTVMASGALTLTGGSLTITTSGGGGLNIGGSGVGMSSPGPVAIKTPAFNVDAASFGFKANDPDNGLLPIVSTAGVSASNPTPPVIAPAPAPGGGAVGSGGGMVLPNHEPWTRDNSGATRNPLWKP